MAVADVTTTDRIVMRRFTEMKKAAVAYAITRIADFSNEGVDLNPNEREALMRLATNMESETK